MRRLADWLAGRLGYVRKASVPRRVEVEDSVGRPPFVLIEYGDSWRSRVAGYVFPALDIEGRGVTLEHLRSYGR